MPRKRKQITNENDADKQEVEFPKKTANPVFVVVQNSQINESFHMKYVKELHHIYSKVKHFYKLLFFVCYKLGKVSYQSIV